MSTLSLDRRPASLSGNTCPRLDVRLDWKFVEKKAALCIMLIYQLWLARNEAGEETQIEEPHTITKRTMHLTEEWMAINTCSLASMGREREHWHPPDPGWVKANANGAFSSTSGNRGIGVVLRDHHSGFQGGHCCFLSDVTQ
jgi:hypothetical protein